MSPRPQPGRVSLPLSGLSKMKKLALARNCLIALGASACLLQAAPSFSQQIANNLIHRYDPSRLASDGKLCAEWYLRHIGLRGDGYRVTEVDGTVISIEVYGIGRPVQHYGEMGHSTSCEIKSGRLDHEWTKIHAKRGGWQTDIIK